MSEMIKRVARSLARSAWNRMEAADSPFAQNKYPRGAGQYCDERWAAYETDAQAAIEAMREPTDEMESALLKSGDDYEIWPNMIAAALGEPIKNPTKD